MKICDIFSACAALKKPAFASHSWLAAGFKSSGADSQSSRV
jgi:hypothetical protein